MDLPDNFQNYQLLDDETGDVVGTVAQIAELTGKSPEAVYSMVGDGQAVDGILYSLRRPPKRSTDETPPEDGLPVGGVMPGGGVSREIPKPRPQAPILQAREGEKAVYEFALHAPESRIGGGDSTLARSYSFPDRPWRTRSWPTVTAAAFNLGISESALKGFIAAGLVHRDCRYSYEPELPAAAGAGTADESMEVDESCARNSRKPAPTAAFVSRSGGIRTPPPPPPRAAATGAGAGATAAPAVAARASVNTKPAPSSRPAPPSKTPTEEVTPSEPPRMFALFRARPPSPEPETPAAPPPVPEPEPSLKPQGEPMAIGAGVAGETASPKSGSRRRRPIEASNGKGKVHPCSDLSAAEALTGISPYRINAAIEKNQPVDGWTFRWADGTAAPPARALARRRAAGPEPIAAPLYAGPMLTAADQSLLSRIAGNPADAAALLHAITALGLQAHDIEITVGPVHMKIGRLEAVARG